MCIGPYHAYLCTPWLQQKNKMLQVAYLLLKYLSMKLKGKTAEEYKQFWLCYASKMSQQSSKKFLEHHLSHKDTKTSLQTDQNHPYIFPTKRLNLS